MGKISSFPMKGTIEASIVDAERILLNDKKEFYEHTTIVDLIRNDLSKVAEKVWVEKFRYIDRIKKQDCQELLQVSSQVSGLLSIDWREKLGDIIFSMLPAGSISGAPKDKTLEIIAEAEKYTYKSQSEKMFHKRGFYTGICGIFDGKTFDSGVMIRFIEKSENGLVFKSGGGITANSIAEKEYQEMIQKIYVPIV
jgi:para-aminobenzoate synthetase component I